MDPVCCSGTEHTAVVAPRIKHGGLIYEAEELPSSVYRATRFPSRCDDYGSARSLFASISDLFKHRLDLPDRESALVACFAVASWLVDRLPTAPILTISGPEQEIGISVLALLDCVCRHPLMSAGFTAGALRSLPTQFGFTLLVCQEGTNSRMERLFRASRFRGVHLLGNRGKVIDLYGPKAIFCGNDAVDLGGGAIEVSAAPSRMTISSALDLRVQDEIAEHFQPRLLMYRLKNCGKLPESPVEVSSFTFATQQLARAIAACFPDDPELAREAVELLRPQDDEIRGQWLFDVNRGIIEVLWGMIHGGTRREVTGRSTCGGRERASAVAGRNPRVQCGGNRLEAPRLGYSAPNQQFRPASRAGPGNRQARTPIGRSVRSAPRRSGRDTLPALRRGRTISFQMSYAGSGGYGGNL